MKKRKHSRLKSLRVSMYFLITFLFLFCYFWYSNQYFNEKVFLNKSSHIENIEKIELEKRISKMVSGYPIEEMLPYIMEQDQLISIFLISIAKKESDWGKKTPKYKGKECFNYWGYRGPNILGSGGHSCFASRQEAIDVISKGIDSLIKQGINTPAKMIVWKCGSSCDTHTSYSVKKWIGDVELYFKKLSK